MKRLAEEKIMNWKDSKRRKPLIIRGARQVGKTWLVDNFLACKFDSFVKVDLEKQRNLHSIFEQDLDPQRIINELEIVVGRIIPGTTLLFIDEIQACPKAIMALRYFYEELPELHIVVAGSLLEFAFSQISVPVGRVQYLHVYPMTFYEYLLAIGKDVMASTVINSPESVSETINTHIFQELKKYFFVGGMPECVKVYRDTNSLIEVFDVQSEILESYRQDFAKYKPHVDTACLDNVFVNASMSVGEQIKYNRLSETFSGVTNKKAFDLLVKANLIHKISSSNPSGLPLAGLINSKKFKSCMLDIGLMQRLCGIDVFAEQKHEELLSIYQGKLAEQFVAQELIAWHNKELFFWARDSKNSNAEVDFLTVKDGKIYPIEVKSGSSGRLRSLHILLETYRNCEYGWILQCSSYKKLLEQKLVFWPLYATSQLGNQKQIK
jgi:uncharacterized protein